MTYMRDGLGTLGAGAEPHSWRRASVQPLGNATSDGAVSITSCSSVWSSPSVTDRRRQQLVPSASVVPYCVGWANGRLRSHREPNGTAPPVCRCDTEYRD